MPLHNDLRDQWQTDFNMSDNDFNNAQRSYDRTDAIVSEGLTKSKEYLAQQKQQREDDYLAQAQNADTRLTRRDIDMLLDRLQTANPESAQVAGTTDDEFRQKFAALARKKVGERPPEE